MARQLRQNYVDFSLIRLAALLHTLAGAIILIISGIVLFTLPPLVFYLTFLTGFYLFLPGIVITFGLVHRRTARHWAKYMVPIWKWLD